jgi:hypothetical protein
VGLKISVPHPTLPTGNPIDVTTISPMIVVLTPVRLFENTHCTNWNSSADSVSDEISVLGFSKRQYQKLMGECPCSKYRTDVLAVLPRKSRAMNVRLNLWETIVVDPVHLEIVEYFMVQFVNSPAK